MHKKNLQKKKRKFRLLLDSAFAQPSAFPKLKKKANVAHCVHDLGLSAQAEDAEIYQKAVENNRFVLTINFNDFKTLIKKGAPGVIGIPSQLTNQQIDEAVSNFLSNKNPEDFQGKATKINSL